jgi:hypothetical protein
MVIALAGQATAQSLQAIQRYYPVAYLRKACSPLNLGESGPFSYG